MTYKDIDWRQFAGELLWHNIVSHKNEDSGYDIMLDDYPDRKICAGDISGWRFCSYVDPFSHKPLTWKELAIELGFGEEYGLFWDGHDCDKCPNNKDCTAFFKGDKDHERCRWWMVNMNKEKE